MHISGLNEENIMERERERHEGCNKTQERIWSTKRFGSIAMLSDFQSSMASKSMGYSVFLSY